MLPALFEKTLFTLWEPMSVSSYIRAMHPKTGIRPQRLLIESLLKKGWAGQLKIHGHRAQIHLSSDPKEDLIAYNRQGKPHKKLLPLEIIKELRRLFEPTQDWNVIDAEWIKPKNKLYIFDFLKYEGKVLSHLTYSQRSEYLRKDYLSPNLSTLPLLKTLDKCLNALERSQPYIEGLVFKSLNTPGFSDTSIIRCRKIA